jgi:hypothetical protein
MASATGVKQNDRVPIFLQLETGVSDKFPVAYIYNVNGGLINSITMTHVSDGLYLPNTPFIMPNANIVVQYIVFDDVSLSVKSEEFGEDKDVFVIDTGSSTSGASDEATDLFGVIVPNEIIGSIDKDVTISGRLESSQLTGKISSSLLTGIMRESLLSAKITEDLLIGSLSEC